MHCLKDIVPKNQLKIVKIFIDDDKSSFCTCCSTAGSDEDRQNNATSLYFASTSTVNCNDEVWMERWQSRCEQLQQHADYDQVSLDVRRTLKRFPPNVSSERRQRLQFQLTPIIVAVLASNTHYRYYQVNF